MHTKSLKHPLIEVGYSNRPQARLKKHTSHSSTNYAGYLAESVATVLFDRGSLKKLYEMKQFIIFICHAQSHDALSGIVLTRPAEGYMGNGGGFTHDPAGRSNDSALKTPESEWNAYARYTLERSLLRHNLEVDRNRMEHKYTQEPTGARKKVHDALIKGLERRLQKCAQE
jgi:hypothetical protein